jgi:hypothetical protein
MTSVPAPICLWCKHFDFAYSGMRCKAFPERIPDEIVDSKIEHREPIEGDHGYVFQRIEDGAELAALWRLARRHGGGHPPPCASP